MFTQTSYSGTSIEQYTLLGKQLDALLEGETNTIANLSNASALLNQFLERINWVGFYLMEDGELVLGPFQGLPACVRIQVGKGVCGTAVSEKKTMLIEDVHAFPGHIACDAASQSEIVIPLIKDGEVIGVLDIDSPELSRFTKEDQEGLELFTTVLLKHL
ncbi:GAF domain-containing protein [Planococcus shenhongbingii]|uniref:GAF domain-containing protein n=1 Tax=Planococcus shenhongbingii TaxID=3058398 RepID=A0ABT8NEU8_9BACL|nr:MULTISPECIES: GAF domain-containing protein [unclassified Planococcus (in: firmicutes)]MDN7246020.1 GAF domain-containing protein [Planococcus sp. N017]WKA59850.1 GAF domain-containing protein [Planococcus sp. N016]